MSKISITDVAGREVGVAEFPDDLLAPDKGDQAVRDVIIAYRAGIRGGNASTLTKGMVAGSNKKPWRQKGLGRARAGRRQSPVWRGGGVAFGPHPRSYSKRIPKRVARLAFRRAFSEKLAQESVRVVKDFEVSEPRTRLLAHILKTLKVSGMTLIVLDKVDRNAALAARNVPFVRVVGAGDVNTYQLIHHSNVILSETALTALENRIRLGMGSAE